MTGSSPRMWGTLSAALIAPCANRFIPTHVGNTISAAATPSTWSVHPHACGEHAKKDIDIFAGYGSSPRMWGTLLVGHEPAVLVRFIPTHVGNTMSRRTNCYSEPVHPHACGEHCEGIPAASFICGSSPRMWGTHDHGRFDAPSPRFIPTHVGNTGYAAGRLNPRSVHPHACGEHNRPSVLAKSPRGSSPRMWGTPVLTHVRSYLDRFIPTHVGNTAHPEGGTAIAAVHPHACGEHLTAS